jgi:hypothetical protein
LIVAAIAAAPLAATAPAFAEDTTITTPGGTVGCVTFTQGGATVGTSTSVEPTTVSFSSVGDCI